MKALLPKQMAALLIAGGCCASASAEASRWTLHLDQGPAMGVRSALVLPMALGYPGNEGHMASAAVAYAPSPDWSAHLAVGTLSGTLASGVAPTWADPATRTVHGAVGLFATHRFAAAGAMNPYASAGIVYDGPLAGLHRSGSNAKGMNSWSLAMEAGFRSPKSGAWRLLLDLKRQQRLAAVDAPQRTLSWAPTRVALKLSPLRVSVGTSLQF